MSFKKIRYLTQFMFFLLTLAVFMGLIENKIFHSVFHALHIFPSLSQWDSLTPYFAITIFMLIMPIFFGRIYCSFLCPAGLIQDVIGDIFHKLGIKQRTSPSLPWLSFFIIVLCLSLIFLHSSFYGYLDHYSQLGRSFSLLTVEGFSYSALFGWIFLGLIVLVPIVYPRWFCTVLCPSGALYSMLNKISFLKITEGEVCDACSECEVSCPSMCIHDGKIDTHQCITCLQCTDECNIGSFEIVFASPWKREKVVTKTSKGRRRFLINGLGVFLGVGSGLQLKHFFFRFKNKQLTTIIPPGGNSASEFFSKCSFCNLCLTVCPTHVIESSLWENGFVGFPKPKMNFDKSFCSYDCNLCLKVCPTQAIAYYPLKDKKLIKIGTAKLNKDLCIPYIKPQDCVACAEHCPSKAITIEIVNKIRRPVVDEELCIGCGACQYSCPTLPDKSIIVKTEPVHSIAKAPPLLQEFIQEPIKQMESSEEFPF